MELLVKINKKLEQRRAILNTIIDSTLKSGLNLN